MSAPVHRLFVVGGTGFIGQAICHSALARGWEVLSLSRHGAPTRSTSPSSVSTANTGIQWIKGDALKPETFQEHLVGCTAVVHSVGVLMENSYKKFINMGGSSSNPPTAHQQEQQQTITYEMANRDTALSVARAAREVPGVEAFAYISASDVLPFLDSRYISTKRQVENDLIEHSDRMRPIILRPGFIYSQARPITIPIAAGVRAFNAVFHRTPVGCLLKNTPLAKAASPALCREVVASAVVSAIGNKHISGILGIEDIERIGNRV
ncbi:hypothetical protein LPJ66_009396 [Kickxella alabastrina]|uniref:Uncharacterized protein n=1 Tax=Kickxella alabastrina TaxID=61397 RepID=A0ACC1I711_9FUNG|nr:hypothetical protein LPJ66_009396 [Kickxella alabastrina]